MSVAYYEGVIGSVTNHTDHLRMIGIAGHHNITALLCRPFGEMLNSGDEGTGCVNDLGCTLFQLVLHLGRNAVRANDCDGVAISFTWSINGRYAFTAQALHLLRVVN